MEHTGPPEPGIRPLPPPAVWLHTICRKNDISATDSQLGKLTQYVALLLEWNSKVNLVSRKDTDHIWQAHILHSLSVLFMVDLPSNASVLDLGSGGGLPGVVLKIMRPDLSVTCLDATKKKIDAVTDMVTRLCLEGVGTAWGRAEELGKLPAYRESFDIVLARAVAPLNDLIKWSGPFLRRKTEDRQLKSDSRPTLQGPALIALKGGDLESELKKSQKLPRVKGISVRSLAFFGAEQVPGVDKKIVIVDFKS